jgi:hypothetical protein
MTAKARNHDRKIKLCESTLRHQTRDVYGRILPIGRWKCTITHASNEDLKLDIRAMDDSNHLWSAIKTDHTPCIKSGTTEIESRFSVISESEVKFIISAAAAKQDISYRCDIIKISAEKSRAWG